MRDVVLVYLNHCPPGILFVRQLGLAAKSDDRRVICCNRNQTIKRIGSDFGVRIDRKEEFVQLGVNAFAVSLSAHFAIRHFKYLPITFLI